MSEDEDEWSAPHTERVFPAPHNGVSAGSEGYGAVGAP